MIWPDEHFQTLEPASKVIFDHAFLSWEWKVGYRPWTIPALYLPLFYVCKVLGITGGSLIIALSRLFTASMSTWALLRIENLLEQIKVSFWPRLIALVLISFSPSMIFWSCSTLADHWVFIGFWGILPTLLDRLDKTQLRDWFISGMLAGIIFTLKSQSAFLILGIGVALPLLGITWAQIGAWLIGCLADVLLLGVLDFFTWGTFFHTLIEQFNLGISTATQNGISPWWYYFSELLRDQGITLFFGLALSGLSLLIFQFKSIQNTIFKNRKLLVIFLPCLFSLLFHTWIQHKELRFILPIFPIFYILLACLLDPLQKYFIAPSLSTSPSSIAASSVLLLSLSMFTIHRCNHTVLPFTACDSSDLESTIYEEDHLSKTGESCIILVDHNWAWTRGQLILGRGARFVERQFHSITEEDANTCLYAIIPKYWEEAFQLRAEKYGWNLRLESKSNYVLFARNTN